MKLTLYHLLFPTQNQSRFFSVSHSSNTFHLCRKVNKILASKHSYTNLQYEYKV